MLDLKSRADSSIRSQKADRNPPDPLRHFAKLWRSLWIIYPLGGLVYDALRFQKKPLHYVSHTILISYETDIPLQTRREGKHEESVQGERVRQTAFETYGSTFALFSLTLLTPGLKAAASGV